jgi:hypothetical protein
MIWKFALPDPRIVYIKARRLRTDDDPSWWKRVRSDKAIEGPAGPAPYPEADDADDDESSYDFFDIEDYELDKIERKMACKRLLTPDDKFTGRMTRADAKAILMRPEEDQAIVVPGIHCPEPLHGVYSESGIPSLLLVCKESFGVASKSYTAAFGAQGALPQTYFDFRRDTLYLGSYSLLPVRDTWFWNWRFNTYFDDDPPEDLEYFLPTNETSMVESLAVLFVLPCVGPALESDFRFISWSYSLHRTFPRLKRLTIVERHYTPGDCFEIRAEDTELRFVDSTRDLLEKHFRFTGLHKPVYHEEHTLVSNPDADVWMLGVRCRRRRLSALDPPEWVKEARCTSEQNSNVSWPPFQINYKSIIAEAYENQLLKQASQPKKESDKYHGPIHARNLSVYDDEKDDTYLPEDNDIFEDDYDLEGVTDEDMLRLANEAEASMN